MKVLLINGSPHKEGCTYTALDAVAKSLQEEGIEAEIFHVGNKPIAGCMGCGACVKLGKCKFDDTVNECAKIAKESDAIIIGSPVHYASASGMATSFMDRLFYSSGGAYKYKLGAVVASARRAGTTAALDQLTKHFSISNMPIISSCYWNMVHGNTPEEVKQDLEGMQIMRTLGKNMAWMLKCVEAGKQAGINRPESEAKVKTNFIR